MASRFEVRLSGSGGQGLALAGKILAEAAAIYSDQYATQSQSYGPEARGGLSKSEVVISPEPIDFPEAFGADILLAMTQQSYERYQTDLKPGGVAVVDGPIKLSGKETFRVCQVPVTELAREKVGKVVVANIIALGVIVGISKVVSEDALRSAVVARAPKGTEQLNMRALEIGLEAARSFLDSEKVKA